MSAGFAPWQQRVFERATRAHAAGRLPHALLLCGPERMGKRALAEALAQAIVCTTPNADGSACGRCVACTRFCSRYQRDPLETRPDDSPAHPAGHAGHPDVRFVGFALSEKASPRKMYQELVIEQVRELSAWLALTPSSERGKVALIEPAHLLNQAAANALLKTLEEPVPGRYVLLVTDQPARLPATIRSRCQRFELKLPVRDEALDWLREQGESTVRAEAALAANLGHPGLALAELRDGGAALRNEVAKDLVALASGRAQAGAVATTWIADRLGQRLRLAVEALREFAAGAAGGTSAGSRLGEAGLAPGTDARRLANWFDEANRAQALLRSPLRQDLLLADLLRRWRDLAAPGSGTGYPGASNRL